MLLGVVLCGGQSKRMGSDKGLLRIGSCTWAELTVMKLTKLGIPVYISVNEAQYPSYQNIFIKDKLIVDTATVEGPLRGILSIHKGFPADDLLVLSCDMINMDEQTLENLVSAYKEDSSLDYYSYVIDNFIQPFPSIYPSGTLSSIVRKADKRELNSFSLTNLIGTSKFRKMESNAVASFFNCNNRDSIKG